MVFNQSRRFEILFKKRLTVELTWGETSRTRAYMKEETPNESPCFALTSNDLLDRRVLEEREARARIVEQFFVTDARLPYEFEKLLNQHVAKIAHAVRTEESIDLDEE